MPNEEAILEIAELIADGVALSDALLAGDLVEARFRSRLVAGQASLHGIPRIEARAFELVRLLEDADHPPLPSYAEAVLKLSEELVRVLTLRTD